MKKRTKTICKWVTSAIVACALVSLVTCWMMFQHIPSWYQPVLVAPADHQDIKDDLTYSMDRLSVSLVKKKQPFEYRFTQKQINSWIAIRREIWPLSRNWLPQPLSDPFIAIDEKNIRIAATYKEGKIKTVINATLQVVASDNDIFLKLIDVAGGSLTTPNKWVHEQLLQLDRQNWPAGKTHKYQYGNQKLPQLANLYQGINIPNSWILINGKKPFKITNLKLEAGAAVITFQPLNRQPPRRRHSQTSSAPANNDNS